VILVRPSVKTIVLLNEWPGQEKLVLLSRDMNQNGVEPTRTKKDLTSHFLRTLAQDLRIVTVGPTPLYNLLHSTVNSSYHQKRIFPLSGKIGSDKLPWMFKVLDLPPDKFKAENTPQILK
jgi:hypothetical protein